MKTYTINKIDKTTVTLKGTSLELVKDNRAVVVRGSDNSIVAIINLDAIVSVHATPQE